MRFSYLFSVFSGFMAIHCQAVSAHGFAGDHMFISTMLLDDANVADEASLPTFSFLPGPSDSGQTPGLYGLGFEIDKRLTENVGLALNQGYNWVTQSGVKTTNGWQNLVVTLKYKPYVNEFHEFLVSIGVQRLFARTGANGVNGANLGNEDSSSTIPTVYFAKGLGDVPFRWLRPLALTGELGYQVADKKLKVDPITYEPSNRGISNAWVGGLSLQYSIRYLSTEVKDYRLPAFLNRLTPVVEVSWSSPASRPTQFSTTYLWGIGINYTADSYAFGIEALVPGNHNTGSHIGFIAQFHLYFDDLLPHSLGKPIVDWF